MSKKQYVPTELGERPIGTLLFRYAAPAIAAMAATSLYNIVDRAFIGHCVGKLALGGLTATFPFMNLSIAFGAIVGLGACTVISVRLGQKEYDTAQRVLGNSVMLNVIIGILFSVVFWPFLDPLLLLFGASPVTLPYAREYMEIVLFFNVVGHSYLGLNSVMRAAGHPIQAMLITLATILANCILDPVFMIVFNMGIRGAAIATVISQFLGLVMVTRLFCRKEELLHLQRGIYRLKASIVRQIIAIGASPFLLHVCACLVVLLINRGMQQYGGDDALTAYGITNSVAFMFIMIVLGLTQGMQPILGYNWGAHKNDRVRSTFAYSAAAATLVTMAGFLIGEFCPRIPTLLFTTDEGIISIASRGFRITLAVFPIVGAQIIITNFFQSIGHAGKSIFLSLTRQLLFLVPCLIMLPRVFGLDGVWMSIPISDALSFLCGITMFCWQMNKIKITH